MWPSGWYVLDISSRKEWKNKTKQNTNQKHNTTVLYLIKEFLKGDSEAPFASCYSSLVSQGSVPMRSPREPRMEGMVEVGTGEHTLPIGTGRWRDAALRARIGPVLGRLTAQWTAFFPIKQFKRKQNLSVIISCFLRPNIPTPILL